MKIKKLVVKEFTIEKDDTEKWKKETLIVGSKYSHFIDPKTKKFYRPVEGFSVTGEDLSDRFIELD